MPPYIHPNTTDDCVALFDEEALSTATAYEEINSTIEVEQALPSSSPQSSLAANENETMRQGKTTDDVEVTGCDSTIIVFDWDDTLYPSSWIHGNGWDMFDFQLSDLTEYEQSTLSAFEDLIISVLQRAMKLGKVMIVTDAEQDWVELSASTFMPRVAALLEKSSVLVVSARSSFERKHPRQPSEWKRETFVKYVYGYHSNAVDFFPRNIISVGDGPNERAALHSLVDSVPGLLGKCVKLIGRPTVDELHVQMEMLLGFLTHVCRVEEPLDLQLSKERV